MLANRLRRWTKINPTLGQHLVFAEQMRIEYWADVKWRWTNVEPASCVAGTVPDPQQTQDVEPMLF